MLHDSAEFLQFLTSRPFASSAPTEMIWQARCEDGASYRVTEQGQSAPLLLPPPGDRRHDGD